MKFLDLNTGYSFDGLWTDSQQKGYIFWFPKEQSINITYSMPIAVITDDSTPLNIQVEDNDVFDLISYNQETTVVDGYEFVGSPIYDHTFTTSPEQVNNKFIHVFNVSCCSENAGEYVCKIQIGDSGFIRVGADLYGEDESMYINLANFGVEIPAMVQKAIYDSNVHEDIVDNILVNRKFKELLSNYWNIVANKGSYKSLLNALEWFEWDDQLKLRAIDKRIEANRTVFNDTDVLSILNNDIINSFNNFAKTTYVSVYCSLQDELQTYDTEYNPELTQAVLKWSKADIQLKISLLAQFFGGYFMPIHMSLLHAAAEDTVFTNTIKAICGGEVKRVDAFGDFNYATCNIHDNDVFKITNVKTQVTKTTLFDIDSDDLFGVDIFPTDGVTEGDNVILKYYTGPGVIIPFEIVIPNQTEGDFIKETIINYINSNSSKRIVVNDIFNVVEGKITVNPTILIREADTYTMNFTFITGSSKTIIKSVTFVVEDAENLNINIYKIKAKDDTNGLTTEDFVDTVSSKYLFKLQNGTLDKSYYHQYLPYITPEDPRYDTYNGIKLSRTIVVDVANKNGLGKIYSKEELQFLRSIMLLDYLEYAKYDYTDPINPVMTYLIFVSKKFFVNSPQGLYNNLFNYTFNVIRDDLGFYPQFHMLEKMDGDSIENYTIAPYEAVCCAIEVNDGGTAKPFRYGNMITNVEWSFYNHLTTDTVSHPATSQQPFVATDSSIMLPGYYDVIFKYSLTPGVMQEYRLNSAFRIK